MLQLERISLAIQGPLDDGALVEGEDGNFRKPVLSRRYGIEGDRRDELRLDGASEVRGQDQLQLRAPEEKGLGIRIALGPRRAGGRECEGEEDGGLDRLHSPENDTRVVAVLRTSSGSASHPGAGPSQEETRPCAGSSSPFSCRSCPGSPLPWAPRNSGTPPSMPRGTGSPAWSTPSTSPPASTHAGSTGTRASTSREGPPSSRRH